MTADIQHSRPRTAAKVAEHPDDLQGVLMLVALLAMLAALVMLFA